MSRTISLVKTESLSSRIRNASGTLGLWFLLYGCAEILRMIVLSIHQLFWVYSAIRSIKAFRDYLYMHIILIVVLEIIIALIIINLGSKSRNWGSVLNDNLVKKTGLPIIVHGTVRVINSLYILINMNTIINIAVNQSVNPDYELSFEEAYIVVISSYLDMLTLILGLVAFAFLGYVLIFTSEHFDEFKDCLLYTSPSPRDRG